MARKDPEIEAVEEMLVEAWGFLMRSPDQERGWLRGGNAWPQIVRDPITDYAEQEAPRRPLSRREVEQRDRVFVRPDALVMRLTGEQRVLLALVLAMKHRGEPDDGGLWASVLGQWRKREGNGKLGTSDGLRVRYGRILDKVAAMERAAAVASTLVSTPA